MTTTPPSQISYTTFDNLPSTPGAPRLGPLYDNWNPYQLRKSSRISKQRAAAARSPSPSSSHRTPQVPKDMSSANMSPKQKKRMPAPDSVRRASENTKPARKTAKAPVSKAMLLTPSKTPVKPPTQEQARQVDSFARNLFGSKEEPSSAATPANKRSKKYTGLGIDSFTTEEPEISIFTDSQDRVPQKDTSAENPFYGSHVYAPVKPSKKKVMIPGVGPQTIAEAARRTDGFVKTFRGTAYFHAFERDETTDQDEPRPELKPVRLFQKKPEASFEDEEASTDEEDNDVEEVPQTPSKPAQKRATTPDAPKFGFMSPPGTRTRSQSKFAPLGTPIDPATKSSRDLFQGSKKRSGDSLAQDRPKRTRI